MTQYNTLNVKLSNSYLNKLTSGLTNGTEVNFNLSSNLNGSFNVENNYPPKVILIDIQVSNIRKGFANVPSANIKVKFSNSQVKEKLNCLNLHIWEDSHTAYHLIFNKRIIPLMRSIVNEPKKIGAKKLNKYIFADAGLNVIGKKIIKVIKSLENRRILRKKLLQKLLVKKEDLPFFFCYATNDSWFTINENCTHSIS